MADVSPAEDEGAGGSPAGSAGGSPAGSAGGPVAHRATDGDDRAQLIIVTGLAIGVTLIALVVILNTVIYTENLATRSAGVGGGKAVQYRATAMDAAGGVVAHENREEYPTWARARDNVTYGVSRVDRFLRLQYVEGETAAEVTNVSADRGALIRQTNVQRNFTSSANFSDWTLVTDIDDRNIRAFDLVVHQDELDPAADDPTDQDSFNVSTDDGLGNQWRLSVYTDGSDIRLAVHNGSQPGVSTLVCGSPYSGGRLHIDLTAGTVNGTKCAALQYERGLVGDYTLFFENGALAGGGYNFTVNRTVVGDEAQPQNLNLAGDPGGPLPYLVPAAYSLRFDVHYEQPRLTYRDRVRVAPGEPE